MPVAAAAIAVSCPVAAVGTTLLVAIAGASPGQPVPVAASRLCMTSSPTSTVHAVSRRAIPRTAGITPSLHLPDPRSAGARRHRASTAADTCLVITTPIPIYPSEVYPLNANLDPRGYRSTRTTRDLHRRERLDAVASPHSRRHGGGTASRRPGRRAVATDRGTATRSRPIRSRPVQLRPVCSAAQALTLPSCGGRSERSRPAFPRSGF